MNIIFMLNKSHVTHKLREVKINSFSALKQSWHHAEYVCVSKNFYFYWIELSWLFDWSNQPLRQTLYIVNGLTTHPIANSGLFITDTDSSSENPSQNSKNCKSNPIFGQSKGQHNIYKKVQEIKT